MRNLRIVDKVWIVIYTHVQDLAFSTPRLRGSLHRSRRFQVPWREKFSRCRAVACEVFSSTPFLLDGDTYDYENELGDQAFTDC